MPSEINIPANDTTEVRFAADALRRSPLLDKALLDLAAEGVTDLTSIKVIGLDKDGTKHGTKASRDDDTEGQEN